MGFITLNEMGKNKGPIAVRAEHVQTVKAADLMGASAKTNKITGEREQVKEGDSTVLTLQGGGVLIVEEAAEDVLELLQPRQREQRREPEQKQQQQHEQKKNA